MSSSLPGASTIVKTADPKHLSSDDPAALVAAELSAVGSSSRGGVARRAWPTVLVLLAMTGLQGELVNDRSTWLGAPLRLIVGI